ncbi:MAG: histidine kinase [Bacteroidales bacterium]|nr:histidine kinase [Bacteroidales bacterium]
MNIKKIIKSEKIIFPFIFWAFLYIVFFISMYSIEGLQFAFKLSSLILLPLIVPVHLHEYIFKKYLLKKKYKLYIIGTALIILVFGYFTDILGKYIDPNGNVASYISIFLFMLVYTGAKYIRIGTKQQFRLKELEAKQAQAELELLKSQINPHFLFNSLNSIYSLTLKNSDKSSEAVMLLSDLMRYILETGKKKLVPLEEEIQFINNYIDLEKLRLGSNFNLDYQFFGDHKNLYISPMILIAFVENIFKHGVSSDKDKNEFDIQIKIEKDQLIFLSTNNIAQKSNDPNIIGEKTGIENVKKRLELLYPGKHNLTIENINSKFLINLQIKLSN